MAKLISFLALALYGISHNAYCDVKLFPISDAYIHRATSAPLLADIAWGDPMRISRGDLRVSQDENYNLATLVKFDLSSYNPATIKSNGVLTFIGSSDTDSGINIQYEFSRVALVWQETSVTWNMFAGAPNGQIDRSHLHEDSTIHNVRKARPSESVMEFIIAKEWLIEWATHPDENHGFLIQTNTPLTETGWYSKEVLLIPETESPVSKWAPTLTFAVHEVTEPSTLSIFFAGLGAILIRRKRNASPRPSILKICC